MADGDEEFIAEILNIFLDEVPVDVTKLEDSHKSGALEDARFILHKTRSKLKVFGLTELQALCGECEVKIKSGEGESISQDTWSVIIAGLKESIAKVQQLTK